MELEKRSFSRLFFGAVLLAGVPAFTAYAPRPFPAETKDKRATLHEERTCRDRFSQVRLAGQFVVPATGEVMNLWLGKALLGKPPLTVMLSDAKQDTCQATCKVVALERYHSDFHPASLQLECEGVSLNTMRMPAFLRWEKDRFSDYHAVFRMGSGLYKTQEARLRVEKDNYTGERG